MTIGGTVAVWLAGVVASGDAVLLAQLAVRQQIIIRVPASPRTPAAPVVWDEKGGPKCIAASALAGAEISRQGVDLLLKGGTRVRAKIGSNCPPLDYYSGFYIRPGTDGRICQDRDTIRVRSGGSCEIDRFRTLIPLKKK